MKQAVKTADRVVNGLLEFVVITMLAVMSAVVFAQVVFRLIHASIPWSEELSKYLLIWSTFLGAALGVRKGSLIGLEFFAGLLPKKGQRVLTVLVDLSVIALLALLIGVGYWASGRVWYQTTPVMKLPMGLMYAAVPTGALFMLFNTLISMYNLWKGEN
ncbi:MAG: TRAP transporter small permease [Eubacteriales bacterium]|nr:TRAP transporter small permease [Eubacteriales bacterium]